MKIPFKFRGRHVKPFFTLGEDIKTGEMVLCTEEALTPKMICYFFLVIASLNNQTPEEFAPLLVRGANHILQEEPDIAERIRKGKQ